MGNVTGTVTVKLEDVYSLSKIGIIVPGTYPKLFDVKYTYAVVMKDGTTYVIDIDEYYKLERKFVWGM